MNEKLGCATDFWKNAAPDPYNGTYDAYHYCDDLTDVFDKHTPQKILSLFTIS